MNTLENIIYLLKKFWSENNCSIVESFDMKVGAGTLHPITFFNCINYKKKKISFAYVQPTRRPLDSNYINNYKLQYYFQFQVIIKPIPNNIQNLFINSLKYIGIKTKNNDIIFSEDNWENPTLSSWGIGWEIRINNLEIAQFTYFQQMGGVYCYPIMIEITYGLERISLILQNINKIKDIVWSIKNNLKIKYYDLLDNKFEKEQEKYNTKYKNTNYILNNFNKNKEEINKLLKLKKPLIYISYEFILELIHYFNILDSRNYFSIFERKNCISEIQKISKRIANIYIKSIKNNEK